MGELGDEEILLCACDDGDIVGYTIRSIIQRIEKLKDAEDDSIETTNRKPLRPFLLHNVGLSAWGLAMHKEARMIAASSNTRKITVFAFALDDADSDQEDQTGLSKSSRTRARFRSDDAMPDRTQANHTIELSGHFDNIPVISFCNLPCDPTGRYLLSADIDGTVVLWNVWRQQAIQHFNLKDPNDQFSM